MLTLLYDKTFPPRSQSQAVGLQGVRDLASSQKRRISKSAKGLYPKSQLGRESMRTFNYYGQTRLESLDENDVDGLKREIDFIIKNQLLGSSPAPLNAAAHRPNHDLGDPTLPKKRTKTAGGHHNQTRGRKKSSYKIEGGVKLAN